MVQPVSRPIFQGESKSEDKNFEILTVAPDMARSMMVAEIRASSYFEGIKNMDTKYL